VGGIDVTVDDIRPPGDPDAAPAAPPEEDRP
jgi:hypothetical protein